MAYRHAAWPTEIQLVDLDVDIDVCSANGIGGRADDRRLGRPPRDKEWQVAKRLFSLHPPRPAAEDYLWTLLNSYDFLFIQ